MSDRLSSRELATVLAALREWQMKSKMIDRCCNGIATDGGTLDPLGNTEICALCEKINTL